MVAQRCDKIPLEQGRPPEAAAAIDRAPPYLSESPLTAPPPPDRSPPPAEIADAGPFPPVDGTLDRALALVEYLREHCPWDRKQTARSLVPHLLEETHETVDAIRAGDADALRDELGDLLLNLAFQVVVAEEAGTFDRDTVVRTLEEKMIRRHPHLFGLGEKESWEAIKARERTAHAPETHDPAGPHDLPDPGDLPDPDHLSEAAHGSKTEVPGVLAGLARGLDPLLRAHRMQEKVSGVGFDWDDAAGAVAKVREELAEVEEVMAQGDPERIEEEAGDLLFAVVNVVRLAGAHPVPALDVANRKFEARFRQVEALARARGVAMPGASLQELDELWDEVKGREAG